MAKIGVTSGEALQSEPKMEPPKLALPADKPAIWVLEDDPGFQFVYEQILGDRYVLTILPTMQACLDALKDESRALPALLIADLRLPDRDFVRFLETEEAKILARVPYMVVSGVDETEALRSCFARGALDYITKPFGRQELAFKVERFLASTGRGDLRANELLMKSGLLPLQRREDVVPLTNKEQQIIAMLQQAENQTLTRADLLQKVWGGKASGQTKTLDVHLHNLRKKIATVGLRIQFNAPNQYVLLRERVEPKGRAK